MNKQYIDEPRQVIVEGMMILYSYIAITFAYGLGLYFTFLKHSPFSETWILYLAGTLFLIALGIKIFYTNRQFLVNFIIVISIFLICSALYIGMLDGFAIYWLYFFPVVAFFLLKKKGGAICNAIYFAILLTIYTASYFRISPYHYNDLTIILSLVSVSFTIFIGYFTNNLTEIYENKLLTQSKELQIEKSKDAAMLMAIGDGIIATDKSGNVVLVNQAAEGILGIKTQDLIGKKLAKALQAEDINDDLITEENRPISKVLSTKRSIKETIKYIRTDGSKITTNVTGNPIISDGEFLGAVTIISDISKEYSIDTAKNQFIDLASHQLRTPLTYMNWNIDLLNNGELGKLTRHQRQTVSKIEKGTQKINGLIESLLEVSNVLAGKFITNPEPQRITDTINILIELQSKEIRSKKLKVEFKNKSKTKTMIIDKYSLEKIISHLLSNSIKYTKKNGNIELTTEVLEEGIEVQGRKISGEALLIKVKDDGIGIPKNQEPLVFKKLFRAQNVQTLDTEGKGLGLYLVKMIVAENKGQIWFESIEETGTTFYVLLPIIVLE